MVVFNQFLLGKANFMLASSAANTNPQKVEHCRQAVSLFQSCLPAFEFLRAHPTAGYKLTDHVPEIQHEMTRCQALTPKP